MDTVYHIPAFKLGSLPQNDLDLYYSALHCYERGHYRECLELIEDKATNPDDPFYRVKAVQILYINTYLCSTPEDWYDYSDKEKKAYYADTDNDLIDYIPVHPLSHISSSMTKVLAKLYYYSDEHDPLNVRCQSLLESVFFDKDSGKIKIKELDDPYYISLLATIYEKNCDPIKALTLLNTAYEHSERFRAREKSLLGFIETLARYNFRQKALDILNTETSRDGNLNMSVDADQLRKRIHRQSCPRSLQPQ